MNPAISPNLNDRDLIVQARPPVDDLLERSAWVDWIDFGITATLSWALAGAWQSRNRRDIITRWQSGS